jgi:aspartate aminotransferase-like enzyme
MRRTVEEWVGGPGGVLGLAYLPGEGRRSWTVSCLKLPEGKTAKPIVQGLAARGWTIGSGYARLKDTTIRIGHMGDHRPESVRELLGALEEVLR